jgi:hypothetical protein
VHAKNIFEHPEIYDGLENRSHGRVPLRLWRSPSFRAWDTWVIIQMKDVFLRRIIWLRGSDAIHGCEEPLKSDVYESLISELETIRMPLVPKENVLGLDGTSCGLYFERGLFSVRLRWWETHPRIWKPLRAWHARAIELFDSLLPESPVPPIDR